MTRLEERDASPLQDFFTPRAVAVVGVSDRPTNLASNIVKNLVTWGYGGEVFPVGRSGGTVHGLPVLTSVDRLPEGVDLACVLTPAAAVPGLVRDLGGRGVRAVNIQSSGFSELSTDGEALAAQVMDAAGAHGVRILGPNCIGTMDAAHRLCTPFSPMRPMERGPISVVSQSGGVLFSYLRDLADARLGFCKAVSFGNKLDVDEADMLAHLAQDPATEVICLYLEDIRRGPALMEAAAACDKPVVLHKSNRGELARSIAASHTASLISDYDVVCAAARQAGVLTVNTTEEALAVARALLMPRLRGRRVAVVSRSGGHAVIAADLCQRHGFCLPPFPETLLAELRRRVRAGVTRMGNPLDLGDLWDMEAYEQILHQVAELQNVDALVYLFVAISDADTEAQVALVELVARVARQVNKPIAFAFVGWRDTTREVAGLAQERLPRPYPVFAEAEEAVEALGVLARLEGLAEETIADAGMETGALIGTPLPMAQCLELLARYRIPVAATRVVEDADAAARAAEELGFPVALKLLSQDVIHKTDVGAVALDLGSADQVRASCARVLSSARAAAGELAHAGFAVQAMARPGLEVVAGFRRDPVFGPVVLVGLGGVLVEVLADTAMRVAPASPAQAAQMLDELAGRPLLDGVRGQPPVDREALAQLVSRLSELALAEHDVAELELNPVLVHEQGCVAVDVRGRTVSGAESPGYTTNRDPLS